MLFKKYHLLPALLICFSTFVLAKENVNEGSGKNSPQFKTLAANCNPATHQIEMSINNVRTTLLAGGDLWWNLSDARYEIPKIEPPNPQLAVHSLFAGAIWLGGLDQGNNLKIAAQTYRQTGNDFWPGPLDNSASIDQEECNLYDWHWQVNGSDINEFIATIEGKSSPVEQSPLSEAEIPKSILDWPARGNEDVPTQGGKLIDEITADLAPFFDRNGNGKYEPTLGDYPIIDAQSENPVYADQMTFWVYNDKGNVHSETGGLQIGIQVNALAFGFETSDEINDMTFYRYKLINKSSQSINQFYMAQWVDPDLGCFDNDYVGCDTTRNLGICYNGTALDPDCSSKGYGDNPPLIGVDYFEGPLGDEIWVIDSVRTDCIQRRDGDSCQIRKQLGLSAFVYYNNDFSVTGNPETAIHYYNYMKAIWKDNQHITEGGTGRDGTVPTNYMFPQDPSAGIPWSECSEGNDPADRRFLQSSGPFTLKGGAVNYITVGVVWVRPQGAYPCPSFESTIGPASDKAQALFDNDFKLVDGPDAPTLAIRELDQEIIISMANLGASNNIGESYNEVDPVAAAAVKNDDTGTLSDSTYTFQGYLLYQLRNQQVTAQDLGDPTQARLVAQVDRKDDVDRIINFEFDKSLGAFVPELMVDGSNDGIRKTFKVTTDLFATGSSGLVNHKTYYFAAVAYAYNNYSEFTPIALDRAEGQSTRYLQGRRNYRIYTAIPHKPEPGRGGTILHAEYGDGVKITRLEGQGNGGLALDLTQASIDSILASPYNFYPYVTYEPRLGPIDVKVYDPMKLKNADFIFTMNDPVGTKTIIQGKIDTTILSDQSEWQLVVINRDNGDVDTINSERDIAAFNEQLLDGFGISVALGQVPLPGKAPDRYFPYNSGSGNDITHKGFIPGNGFIGASIDFENVEDQWLTGLKDENEFGPRNWIRVGNYIGVGRDGTDPDEGFFDDNAYQDQIIDFYDEDDFGNILEGTWAPYSLTTNWVNRKSPEPEAQRDGFYTHGPAFAWHHHRDFTNSGEFKIPINTLHDLHSIDVVFTADKDKWTRCVVFETGEDAERNDGAAFLGNPSDKGANKGQIRMAFSWDKSGAYHNGDNQLPLDTGRSWFPGYAIDLETGERLNMAFGESSWLKQENGNDMIWNPTSKDESPLGQVLFGGKHYIYVMTTRYDEGAAMQRLMLDNYNVLPTTSPLNPVVRNHPLRELYTKIMWTSIPLIAPESELAPAPPLGNLIPSEVKVKLRTSVPYQQYFVDGSNKGYPKYFFSTDGLGTEVSVTDVAETACDLVRVVPNPYYAYSSYETSQIDDRIKIINLPDKCTVSIYTLNGILIRRFERAIGDDTSEGTVAERVNRDSSLDWDLRNFKNIPVSSGIYLVHIEAEGVCEKVIKWFGIKRPFDSDAF